MRAQRRKHKERLKRKSIKLYGDPKYADHLKPCSCLMCCNPRHGWNKETTIQEKRFDSEEIIEYK